MSYRSIKRVLGETNLERKLLFLFGVCLLLVIAGSFWLYGWQTEKMVKDQNRNTGRLLVDYVMLTKHWREMEVRATVQPNSKRQPGQDFRQFVDTLTKSLSKEKHTVAFLQPGIDSGPVARRDAEEKAIVDRFPRNRPSTASGLELPEYTDRLVARGDEYQYYQAVRAEASCLLVCHRQVPGSGPPFEAAVSFAGTTTAHDEGDLMAVVKIGIPNRAMQQRVNWNRAILIACAILTVFLTMITSYVIVRYVIVKPLRHLRDVSDAISHGNMTLRAEINTGDEFEELAVAFNRMLRHLMTVQEELRQVNANLDTKVDELAQANMRLYEMNQVKSDFLATMSHELRTPLNIIIGFSGELASNDSLSDRQKRYVQNIQKSGRNLLDTINDILDLAKVESGKMETRLTDFRVAHVVMTQCDLARPLTERKNIDLELIIQPDLPLVRQDQLRVQQILNNLLSNAIKFTPEGGRITVNLRRDDDWLVLQVIDTGVGIAEEDLQTIFEKFRQGRATVPTGDAMTREYSGTGLGLSIVKELCKLLGGEITVQSELGKGSTFTVRLPWAISEPTRAEAPLAEGFDEFSKARFELPARAE